MDEIINVAKESFDKAFCEYLEYHLTRTLKNSEDKELSRLWCDGVAMPDSLQLTKKNVNDKRQITTKAWVGADGQTEFELVIKFGNCSLRRYSKGTSLNECVPDDDSLDWVTLDEKEKSIELRLR